MPSCQTPYKATAKCRVLLEHTWSSREEGPGHSLRGIPIWLGARTSCLPRRPSHMLERVDNSRRSSGEEEAEERRAEQSRSLRG